MKEFIINKYITIKLLEQESVIYVNKEVFAACKLLILNIPKKKFQDFDDASSIDEASGILSNIEPIFNEYKGEIPPETEFWGHCSNIQTWAENDYDTRILHSSLAFPLLKRLTEVGDPTARRVFKEEIAARIENGYLPVVLFLIIENYFTYLEKDELEFLFLKNNHKLKKNLVKALEDENAIKKYVLPILYNLSMLGDIDSKAILRKEIKKFLSEPNFSDLDLFFEKNYFKFINQTKLNSKLKKIQPDLVKSLKLLSELRRRTGKSFKQIIKIKNKSRMKYSVEDFILTGIGLYKSGLTSVPPLIKSINTFKILDLAINDLTGIPDELGNLSNLKTLYLNGNLLRILPENIINLKNLEFLDLSNNKLRILPESIGNLNQLKVLRLNNNNLKILPNSITNLNSLELLDVSKNILESIPPSINNLKSLRDLNISNNKIKDLPSSFNELLSLDKFEYNNNPFIKRL
jgi:hypothetical protein